MKLRMKLISAFLPLAVLMAIVGTINIQTEHKTDENFSLIVNEIAPDILALGQIKSTLLRLMKEAISSALIQSEITALSHELVNDAAFAAHTEEKEAERAKEELEIWLSKYEAVAYDLQERVFAVEIRNANLVICKLSEELIDMKRNGGFGEEIVNKKNELEEAEEQFLDVEFSHA